MVAMKVLVTGGSGYLGQFLTQRLADRGHTVAFTYNGHPDGAGALQAAARAHGDAVGVRVALDTGAGLQDCVAALGGTVDVIVNCAAISQPGVVQKDIGAARTVNVPSAILTSDALKALSPQPLLIHLSTDQVYEGAKAYSTEEDPPKPVNGYGETKVEAEQAIRAQWENHVILRSSIIYGDTPPLAPVARGLFLQWMDGALAGTEPVSFFNDEFRNPIFVVDILAIVEKLAADRAAPRAIRTFNMGGPERLSRVDMATILAKVKKYGTDNILSVSSATVDRGVKSPPDISMDVSLIQRELGVELTRFEDALATFMH